MRVSGPQAPDRGSLRPATPRPRADAPPGLGTGLSSLVESQRSSGAGRMAGLVPVLIVLATLLLSAFLAYRGGSLVVLLFGAAGFVVLIRRPGLGLAALAALSFLLPLEVGTGSDVSLTAPVLLIPAVAAAWLLEGARTRTLRLPSSPTFVPLLLLVGSGLLSLLAGNAYWDPVVLRPANLLLVQLAQWSIFALSAVAYLLAAALGSRGRWLQIATFVFLAAGGLAVLGHLFPTGLPVVGWQLSQRANSAMFWAWLAALATGQLLHNRSLSVWARLGLLALLTTGAYAVWVRQYNWISGWLPFTVGGLSVVWLRAWRRNRAAGLAIGLLLLTVAVLLYPAVFAYVGGEQELELSGGGRLLLYQATLDVVKDHPILGLGPASYRYYAFNRWMSLGYGRALYLRPAVSSHNNFIDVFAQMGIVGLALLLWFLVAVGRQTLRLAPRFRDDFGEGYVVGTLGGLVGTLVAMMLVDWFIPLVHNVGFPGFRTSALAWMFLGGVLALEQRSEGKGTNP